MPLLQASTTLLDSYAFQLSIHGDLPARLGFISRYWAYYLGARYLGGKGHGQAHLSALERLSALGRSKRVVTIELPDGKRLALDLFTSCTILKEISDGTYDSPACDPREGQLVFDVGAQQGSYTALAAAKVGAKGKVVSFEPEPRNFTLLKENARLNPLANTIPVEAALSDRNGTAELVLCGWNMGGHSLNVSADAAEEKVRVRTRTLDDAAAEFGAPDVIKIDVEGSVLAVLRGGMKTIAARGPAIALEWDSPAEIPVIENMLAPLGYSFRRVENILFATR